MAGSGLVPHVLPSGQTIMVPEYLAPKGPGELAMPSVPAPVAGPDMRVAGPGGGMSDMGDPMEAAARMQRVAVLVTLKVPKVALQA